MTLFRNLYKVVVNISIYCVLYLFFILISNKYLYNIDFITISKVFIILILFLYLYLKTNYLVIYFKTLLL